MSVIPLVIIILYIRFLILKWLKNRERKKAEMIREIEKIELEIKKIKLDTRVLEAKSDKVRRRNAELRFELGEITGPHKVE